jgi:hypothetical protein
MAARIVPIGVERLPFQILPLSWQDFWKELAPHCADPECHHNRGFWHRARWRKQLVLLQGARYCVECLERALQYELQREQPTQKTVLPSHRVPLGLLLLSRQQLTLEQLRYALSAQRRAGYGKIGEWLQLLGFANEPQVVAALARQWSCPILRRDSLGENSPRVPHIPLALLRELVMCPVDFVKATGTLHMAFGEGVDYGALCALEKILGCRTEACMALPSMLRRKLDSLAERREQNEIVFAHLRDTPEISRIVHSYVTRLHASEIRMVRCGPHLWVRLLRGSRLLLDLVLGSRAKSTGNPLASACGNNH